MASKLPQRRLGRPVLFIVSFKYLWISGFGGFGRWEVVLVRAGESWGFEMGFGDGDGDGLVVDLEWH